MILSCLILWPWLLALWLGSYPRQCHRLALPGALVELILTASSVFGSPTSTVRALHFPWLGSLWFLQGSALANVLALTAAVLLPFVLIFGRSLKEFPSLVLASLVLQGALMGTFYAQNFLGFYFFYEILALAGAWLILVTGDRDRFAAFQFLLYTVGGSLLMLVAVLFLYGQGGSRTGSYDFSWLHLATLPSIGGSLGLLLFVGMLAGLAVKLPLFPLHSWAGSAYGHAAPAASILLSGGAVLSGAYGLVHWAIPLLPQAALEFAPFGVGLGVVGTLYGAFLALQSPNLRRFAAWGSVSHMNLVAMGIFALQLQALSGALFLLVAHAVLAAGLFGVIALLEQRELAGNWDAMGGLFRTMPHLGAWMLFFFLTAMGLPGLANFPGEFLSLAGAFRVFPWEAAFGALGILLSVIVYLRAYERVMLGPLPPRMSSSQDLRGQDWLAFWLLGLLCLWLGLDPQALLAQLQGLLSGQSPLWITGIGHGL